jgi:hypothetical protein
MLVKNSGLIQKRRRRRRKKEKGSAVTQVESS